MLVRHGLYGFQGGTAVICRCGHTLAVHHPDDPQPCEVQAHLGESCDCRAFTPETEGAHPTLRSVSIGAVYDDGPRGEMRMVVTQVEGEFVAQECLEWPESRQAIELGRTRTYEGAVEVMWRHVVASASRTG